MDSTNLPTDGSRLTQLNSAKLERPFHFEDHSQRRMSVSSGKHREITQIVCIVHKVRVQGGGVLNLSKSFRLW